ncbi:MAG: hypothetical protein U0599_09240 [Vicinamibacteria bacterium]
MRAGPSRGRARLYPGGRDDARASFVRRVSLHARGQHAVALTQLQAALGRSSELFPAAVYMGACYASLGKDMDAIGAWQTALVGEAGGSLVVYAVLADALTRVKEPRQAVEILGEGLTAFPEDAGLRRRLAHAAAGLAPGGAPLLGLGRAAPRGQRGAHDRRWPCSSTASRARPQEPRTAERARLVRFARAYVEGSGPNPQIIGRWLKYLTAGS